MLTVHLNWTSCDDWHAARTDIRKLYASTMYGNFADVVGEPADVRRRLTEAGFTVADDSQKLGPFEAARFRISRTYKSL